VLARVKVLPLSLHAVVILQLRVGFHFSDAMLDEHFVDVVDYHGVDALTLVFGFHGDEVQVGAVVLFECAQQVDKP